MNMTQKIDVLDMIIGTLREHEKCLDEIVYRLEQLRLYQITIQCYHSYNNES